jgi:hypothetical protein
MCRKWCSQEGDLRLSRERVISLAGTGLVVLVLMTAWESDISVFVKLLVTVVTPIAVGTVEGMVEKALRKWRKSV